MMRLVLIFILSNSVLALSLGCSQNTDNNTKVQTSEIHTDNSNEKHAEDSDYRFLQRSIVKTQEIIEELKFKQLRLLYMWPLDSIIYCRSRKLQIVNDFCSHSARRTDEYSNMCNTSIDVDKRYSNILRFLSNFPSRSEAKLLGENLKRKYEKSVVDYLLPNKTITENLNSERSFLRMLQDSLKLIE